MFTAFAHTLRRLRRSPGFLVVATLSLAIGLALSTTTFAVVDSMIRPHIPIPDLDRVFVRWLRLGNQKNPPSTGEQLRALRSLPGVEGVGVISSQQRRVMVEGVERYTTFTGVTSDFLDLLHVRPDSGRMPTGEEIRTNAAVLVTQREWRTLFGMTRRLGSSRVTIDDRVYTVVGILPLGVERLFGGGLWLPFATAGDIETIRPANIIVKLRPGTDSLSIRPQLATVAANFTAAYTTPGVPAYELRLRGVRPRPRSVREEALALLLTFIGVGVLAIACANVAALALARGLTRRRDHGLRIALGASRFAIGMEVVREVLVVALAGTIIGLPLAAALIGVFTSIVPEDLSWRGDFLPELNARVFALSAATLALGIGIAGGLPAWRASRVNPSDPLKDNAGTTTGRSHNQFRLLVMGELAISMVLVMLASLVTLSTRNLVSFDFGYDARLLIQAVVYLPWRDSTGAEGRERLMLATINRVRAHPRVVSAAVQTNVPVEHEEMISDDLREAPPLLERWYMDVGPGYLKTLGLPLIAGREIVEGDRASGGAVVLTERAAKALFPRGNAIGRLVKFGDERSTRPWLPVVGIAREPERDLRSSNPESPPVIFASTREARFDGWTIAIRPDRLDPGLVLELERILRDVLSPRSSVSVRPMLAWYDRDIRVQRFFDKVFSTLGFAALLLGATGLFSVLTYAVSQRLREFAVRIALGARPRDVLALVLLSGFEMALGGTAVGALLSFWASAGISAMLYGVKNTDPVSLIVAEVTLLVVTMAASLAPALRAMRADPIEVLRAT